MGKKLETIHIILIAILLVASLWYLYNGIEAFETPSRPALIGNSVPIVTQYNRSTSNLELCDRENGNLRDNMKKGINIIYNNHVNNNIKKIVDDYVNIQLLTDRMERINNDLMLRLHKNKKYDTEGEMTFV